MLLHKFSKYTDFPHRYSWACLESDFKKNLHAFTEYAAETQAGWAYSSTLASAAHKCVAAGANVISMSLGGGRKSVTEQKVFDSAQTKGVLSIAAAGNDGNTVVSYPAGYASVMMVG